MATFVGCDIKMLCQNPNCVIWKIHHCHWNAIWRHGYISSGSAAAHTRTFLSMSENQQSTYNADSQDDHDPEDVENSVPEVSEPLCHSWWLWAHRRLIPTILLFIFLAIFFLVLFGTLQWLNKIQTLNSEQKTQSTSWTRTWTQSMILMACKFYSEHLSFQPFTNFTRLFQNNWPSLPARRLTSVRLYPLSTTTRPFLLWYIFI